ncbi:transcriptional regulation of mitochondrial recombination-domain-containing protein [Tirmania nivea]|nr:transcriptional regulation of mitochondrial recombination-domain-containing protein [Tirmania nivea]
MSLKLALPKGYRPPPNPLHKSLGKALFIYNEVYTNQIIYSLHRSMRDTQRKQLSFVGKQSVPASLRKDRWRPLACVHFPTTQFGLSTLRLLREFRIMHETQYDKELLKLPKDKLKKKLQDQKANSVADLSVALQMQLEQLEAKDARTGTEEIVIKWQDVSDGELAKTWPEEVVHMRGARPERYSFAKEDMPQEFLEALSRDREKEMEEHIVKEQERLEEVARVKAVEALEQLEKQEKEDARGKARKRNIVKKG